MNFSKVYLISNSHMTSQSNQSVCHFMLPSLINMLPFASGPADVLWSVPLESMASETGRLTKT